MTGGNQGISGNNTFYDLTKINGGSDTLTFASGDTQSVTDQLDLAGTDGSHQLLLRSSSSPSTWLLDLGGTVDVSALDVKDSQASGTVATCLVNCTDSGNNTGWYFGAPPPPPPPPISLSLVPPQQPEVIRQGNNAATIFIEQAGGSKKAYWIPYGDGKYIQNDSKLNLWEADHALQEPWELELLPSSESKI